MLSRLIPRINTALRPTIINNIRNSSLTVASRPRDNYVEDYENFKMPLAPYEGMGPLPVKPTWDPNYMRHYVIPEYWFEFLYPRTGVTGPYALAFGTTAFLVSKEIYIYSPESWHLFALLTVTYGLLKVAGPMLQEMMHSNEDRHFDAIYRLKMSEIDGLEAEVEDIKTEKWRSGLQEMYHDIKKSNLALMLETEYLNRKASLVSAVKKKLDYQVAVQQVDRELAHSHLVNWVEEKVRKSITPESQKKTLDVCIARLAALTPK
uniref:ATP synthase subunit b, mitochondrial-like n=1 Tax=Styela clava TaxID=7725 RepID=UPI00193958B7|nr:ATP synthase subunit b, mitochondrial-like [Styela clava]